MTSYRAVRELRAHGHHEASRAIGERALLYHERRPAQIALTSRYRAYLSGILGNLERWDDAQLIAEELASEDQANLDYLGILGTLAAGRGERDEALRISEELAGLDRPYLRGDNTYWRAGIAALLDEKEQAVSLLRQAHEEGQALSRIHGDTDFEPLRGYPPFEELMRPKG